MLGGMTALEYVVFPERHESEVVDLGNGFDRRTVLLMEQLMRPRHFHPVIPGALVQIRTTVGR